MSGCPSPPPHPLFSCRMTVWLSTAPTEPLTHWYQVRCLFQSPLFAKAGDTLSGTCLLIANKRWGGLRGVPPPHCWTPLPHHQPLIPPRAPLEPPALLG